MAHKPHPCCSVYLSAGWYYVVGQAGTTGPSILFGEICRIEESATAEVVGQVVLDALGDFRVFLNQTWQEVASADGAGLRLLKLAGHKSDVSFRRVTKLVMVVELEDGDMRMYSNVTRTNRGGGYEGFKGGQLVVARDPLSVGEGLVEAFKASWIQEHLG